MVKEVRQCSSCGGFCKKSGCERENIKVCTHWKQGLTNLSVDKCPYCVIEKLKQHLSNLLARIHRDGGHYEAEHGTDKAVADADLKVARLNSLLDAQSIPWREYATNAATVYPNGTLGRDTPQVDRMRKLLQDALYALEYSADMSKPEGMHAGDILAGGY